MSRLFPIQEQASDNESEINLERLLPEELLEVTNEIKEDRDLNTPEPMTMKTDQSYPADTNPLEEEDPYELLTPPSLEDNEEEKPLFNQYYKWKNTQEEHQVNINLKPNAPSKLWIRIYKSQHIDRNAKKLPPYDEKE